MNEPKNPLEDPADRPIALDDAFFYGPHKNSPDMPTRPMAIFLAELRALGMLLGHGEDFIVLWDADVARHGLVEDAVGFQIFASKSSWYELEAHVRVHPIGKDGIICRTLCFTDDPAPHWFVGRRFSPRFRSPDAPRRLRSYEDFEWPFSMVRR